MLGLKVQMGGLRVKIWWTASFEIVAFDGAKLM